VGIGILAGESTSSALLTAVSRRGGRIQLNVRVAGLERGEGWRVRLENGETIEAGAVVLATGGLSVPATGSDGTGLRFAHSLGHSIFPTYPALVPLTGGNAAHRALAGVSLAARLSAPLPGSRRLFASEGGFLFTHHGYSGPTVLDVSHVAVRSRAAGGAPARLFVRWTPLGDADWEAALLPGGARTVTSALRAHLPERLARALAELAGVDPGRLLAELRREERLRLIETLVRGELPWTADEGYRKAEVTGGGVSLAEVDPRTMESRIRPGLFLCGELLDAFGPIGGYNFLWAWATGRAAGLGAAGVAKAR
jgi:hypothetical protein